MRVLTVRQPWAWAIVHGGKDVENRTRNIAGDYRGPVAIHAAAPKPDDRAYAQAAIDSPYADWPAAKDLLAVPAPLHMGVVLGVVDLVDVHHDHHALACVDHDHGPTDDGTYLACSRWAMPDVYHLRLTNPRPLPAPIRARGKLGLWRPSDELEEALRGA